MADGDTQKTHSVSLEIDHVRQNFDGTVALDDVSLHVEAGQVVCLLGHSGCGKTTMLRVAAGIERPQEGEVRLAGRIVSSRDRFVPPEQRDIGLMFQDYALFPHLTILENVLFGLRRKPPAEARRIAGSALERVGLSRYAGDYPHMLSGGEQQRVALARALAPGPGILLMDEPFSNLDQRMREEIRDHTMSVLRENGTTALVVTHDPVEAMVIADRIALMRSGRIVQTGTAEDLYRRPANLFAARYFCDFNEIETSVKSGVIDSPLGRFALAQPLDNGPCLMCLRPQSISLVVAGVEPLRGTIVTRRFLGDSDHVTISVPGIDKHLHAKLPTGYGAAPGEDVSLRIDPAGILAFSRNAGTPCTTRKDHEAPED